jgi:hypothetical protein
MCRCVESSPRAELSELISNPEDSRLIYTCAKEILWKVALDQQHMSASYEISELALIHTPIRLQAGRDEPR